MTTCVPFHLPCDYTKSQERKKEESEQLRGEIDQMKFIDLGFERWQVVGLSELC